MAKESGDYLNKVMESIQGFQTTYGKVIDGYIHENESVVES